MTDPATNTAPAQARPPATPPWVKALGIALALIVLLVLAKALFGGGFEGHGPGMHGG